MPHKSDSGYHTGAALSQSSPLCLFISTVVFFFPANEHFTRLTTFHLGGKFFRKAKGLGPCH